MCVCTHMHTHTCTYPCTSYYFPVAYLQFMFVCALQQGTVLRETLNGFVFESNRNTKVNVNAENPLSLQFQFGWPSKDSQKFKSKAEVTQEKVAALAATLQGKYFSANQESTRKVVAEMKALLSSVENACKTHDNDEVRGHPHHWYIHITGTSTGIRMWSIGLVN